MHQLHRANNFGDINPLRLLTFLEPNFVLITNIIAVFLRDRLFDRHFEGIWIPDFVQLVSSFKRGYRIRFLKFNLSGIHTKHVGSDVCLRSSIRFWKMTQLSIPKPRGEYHDKMVGYIWGHIYVEQKWKLYIPNHIYEILSFFNIILSMI